jgi:glycosyltransferase involved in cell wall biosynthesis
MRPTVSIIVPCYNASKTVTRTLDSLVNQTLKDIEIVVINDGSKDNTKEVIDEYIHLHKDSNIKFYTKENEGIATARNFAVSKVTGEYFGFLDSDDYAESTMFFDLYTKAKEEDLEVVVSNFYWEVDNEITGIEKEGPYKPGQDMMVHLFAVLWNKIYKTDWIKNLDVNFPDGNRYEDACYLYKLCMHITRIGFIDKAYVHYVQQKSSITHTNNAEVKNMITVFKIILEYYKSHDKYEEYYDALEYIHIKFFLGNSFLRSSRIKDSKDRKNTISMGWNLLNEEFPNWHSNSYLKSLGGMKNKYFSMVRSWNIYIFAWIFRHFKKDNV